MSETSLEAWITLCAAPGLGPSALLRLLDGLGEPEHVLAADEAQLRQYVTAAQAAAIRQIRESPPDEPWRDWLAQPGNRLLTLADADYPRLLLQMPDPPILLYAKGRLELLGNPSLAVVGSRNATQPGIRHAEQFAEHLSQAGLTIISGMASGIDAAAHRGGLRGSGSTIAVVGTGLDRVYPASNRELAHRIAEEGLLLSEFPLGYPPLAANFPKRNRIISGLALGCLVVEAAPQSGSLITARLAAEQGREVFAIPGSIDAPQARGCHQLIKQGAKLVDGAEDILEELRLPERQPGPVLADAVTEEEIPPWLAELGFEAFDMDAACLASGLTTAEVCAILFTLEMSGRLMVLAGGRYQRVA